MYEEVNREIPFDGLHWFFDHCETISDQNLERVKALGGGIAVQNRMAFQGEYFVDRCWELFHDPADPQRYVETFLIESWVEHLRQHERVTLADRAAEGRARALHRGPTPLAVSHLIAVRVTAGKTVWEKA